MRDKKVGWEFVELPNGEKFHRLILSKFLLWQIEIWPDWNKGGFRVYLNDSYSGGVFKTVETAKRSSIKKIALELSKAIQSLRDVGPLSRAVINKHKAGANLKSLGDNDKCEKPPLNSPKGANEHKEKKC